MTYDGEQTFPALVDKHEPLWNGYHSPMFRLDVVIQLARYVAAQNAQCADPEIQDWLVVAPDQRTAVLLVADQIDDGDGERWRLVPELIYPLCDPGDLAQRSVWVRGVGRGWCGTTRTTTTMRM